MANLVQALLIKVSFDTSQLSQGAAAVNQQINNITVNMGNANSAANNLAGRSAGMLNNIKSVTRGVAELVGGIAGATQSVASMISDVGRKFIELDNQARLLPGMDARELNANINALKAGGMSPEQAQAAATSGQTFAQSMSNLRLGVSAPDALMQRFMQNFHVNQNDSDKTVTRKVWEQASQMMPDQNDQSDEAARRRIDIQNQMSWGGKGALFPAIARGQTYEEFQKKSDELKAIGPSQASVEGFEKVTKAFAEATIAIEQSLQHTLAHFSETVEGGLKEYTKWTDANQDLATASRAATTALTELAKYIAIGQALGIGAVAAGGGVGLAAGGMAAFARAVLGATSALARFSPALAILSAFIPTNNTPDSAAEKKIMESEPGYIAPPVERAPPGEHVGPQGDAPPGTDTRTSGPTTEDGLDAPPGTEPPPLPPPKGWLGSIADWNIFHPTRTPHLAEGGVVNQPTHALVGESGPEAVVPLNAGGGLFETIREFLASMFGGASGPDANARGSTLEGVTTPTPGHGMPAFTQMTPPPATAAEKASTGSAREAASDARNDWHRRPIATTGEHGGPGSEGERPPNETPGGGGHAAPLRPTIHAPVLGPHPHWRQHHGLPGAPPPRQDTDDRPLPHHPIPGQGQAAGQLIRQHDAADPPPGGSLPEVVPPPQRHGPQETPMPRAGTTGPPPAGMPSGETITPAALGSTELTAPKLNQIARTARGAKGTSFTEKAGWVTNQLMKDFGLTKNQAAGITGNLGFESGGLNYTQEGAPLSGRGGIGWAQWTGDRRKAFEKYAAEHKGENATQIQYGYLKHELETSQKATIAAVKKTTTVQDATGTVMKVFERPKDQSAAQTANRIPYAQRAAELAGQTPSVVAQAPVTPVPAAPAGPRAELAPNRTGWTGEGPAPLAGPRAISAILPAEAAGSEERPISDHFDPSLVGQKGPGIGPEPPQPTGPPIYPGGKFAPQDPGLPLPGEPETPDAPVPATRAGPRRAAWTPDAEGASMARMWRPPPNDPAKMPQESTDIYRHTSNALLKVPLPSDKSTASNTTTHNVHVGEVHVHTPQTDTRAMVRDIHRELSDNLILSTNDGMAGIGTAV